MESLAKSTGYFFKCSLCNNKECFEEEMKKFGIHVPEQDASWEKEEEAFDDLLERHSSCDAQECLCPAGRTEDEDYTDWEIVSKAAKVIFGKRVFPIDASSPQVLCRFCGAQGIHVACGGLQSVENPKWSCQMCKGVLSGLPPTFKNVYHRAQQPRKQLTRTGKFLASLSFDLKETGVLSCQTGTGGTLSLDLSPSLDNDSTFKAASAEPPAVVVAPTAGDKPNSDSEVPSSRMLLKKTALSKRKYKSLLDPKQRSILMFLSKRKNN